MATHTLQWMIPAPLWRPRGQAARPVILGFEHENFMDELTELLQPDADLVGHVEGDGAALYQAIHSRFYLVAASLVCNIRGLPDHSVKTTDESVGFVMRRQQSGSEEAWVSTSATVKSWTPATAGATLAGGEEVFPLSGLAFDFEGHRRRLLVGMVPTASRDTYVKDNESRPKLDTTSSYRLRCVYRRTQCRGDAATLVSDPSASFTLVGFLDFRTIDPPIHLALPGQTEVSIGKLSSYGRQVRLISPNPD